MKKLSIEYNLVTNRNNTKPKQHKTPEKHKGNLHVVGYYKGHMKAVKGLWNNLHNTRAVSQIDNSLIAKLNNPSGLSNEEALKAMNNRLNVVKGYVLTNTVERP